MSDYTEFFDRLADYRLSARYFEGEINFTVEELYRAFLERLVAESAPLPPRDNDGADEVTELIKQGWSPPQSAMDPLQTLDYVIRAMHGVCHLFTGDALIHMNAAIGHAVKAMEHTKGVR